MGNVVRASLVAGLVGSLVVAGCKKDASPTPEPEKAPVSSASPVLMTSSSAKAAIPLPDPGPPKDIPTLVAEPFAFQGGTPQGIHLLDDGTLAVTENDRVGRLVENKIEWLPQSVPVMPLGVPRAAAYWVGGRWPDAVDVMTTSSTDGRVMLPTYHALTGKGRTLIHDAGSALSSVVGIARIGESTLIGASEANSSSFATVRGPKVIRNRKSFSEGGCSKDEQDTEAYEPERFAVSGRGFGTTGAGTIISMGMLCVRRHGMLEVWEKDNTSSKLIEITPHVSYVDTTTSQVLPGKGDEAWLRPNADEVYRYIDGRVEKVPQVPNGAERIFMSPKGQLYASNKWGIHRWETDHWVPVAQFVWEDASAYFVVDAQDRFWRNAQQSVTLMREGKSVSVNDACTTPFVMLYEVTNVSPPGWTFPTTRKALASFPEVTDLTLVDFTDGKRRLGVGVKSKAQGEALITHLKTAMPKETPRLMCYEPKEPHKIEIQGKGK